MDDQIRTKDVLAAKPDRVGEAGAAVDELVRLKRELAIISRIAEIFLRVPDDDDVYGQVLQVILEATGSNHGLFGYIDEQGDLVCPSMTRNVWQECQMADRSIRFPRNCWTDAQWCRALRSNRSLYRNQPGRVPKGHVPIDRSASIPIAYQGDVIGLLHVGNKTTDYDKDDIALLEGISRHVAPILYGRLERDRIERSRQRAEEALRDSEERFRATFEQAAVGIAQVAPDGRWLRVNQKLCDIIGYSREELAWSSFQDIIHPDDLDADVECVRQMLAGEIENYSMEKRFLRKDGSTVWINLTVALLRERTGKPKCLISVVEDISARKEAEAERESVARFPSENPHPVLRIAMDGAVLYANAAARSLLSGSTDEMNEVPATPWWAMTVHAFELGSRQQVEISQGGKVFSFDVVAISPGIYANWYGRDVTEQRKAESEARKAQLELLERQRSQTARVAAELEKVREELVRKTRLATVGQLSASIAHDLRNPLGAVRNAVFYLKRRVPRDEPELADFLQIIENEVHDADCIISALLDLTRVKPVNKQTVDLRRLVEDAFSRIPDIDGVQCQISMSPDPFSIQVDSRQFRQVFINIGKNAVQAMEGQGELFLEAWRNTDRDEIVVRDTGPGICEDLCAELFEPLVTTKAKGIGLGLTLARQIIEQHSGTLELMRDERPGAAFRIVLPHEDQSAQA